MNDVVQSTASIARGPQQRGWGFGLAYVLMVAGLIVLAIVAALIVWLTLSIDRTAISSRQLLDWREAGYQIMSALQDAETGQRGDGQQRPCRSMLRGLSPIRVTIRFRPHCWRLLQLEMVTVQRRGLVSCEV